MKLTGLICTLLAALTTASAFAAASKEPTFHSQADRKNYLTLNNVTVRKVSSTAAIQDALLTAPAHLHAADDSVGGIIGIITDPYNVQGWVTLGEKAWDIVVANRPSANVSATRVSVLPLEQAEWAKMENWQGPASSTYVIEAYNLIGVKVISHSYTIAFNYGGQLNGAGHYISNATLIPSKVSVSWGYTLNSKVEASGAVNTASTQDPLPGVNLDLSWSVDTVVSHKQGVESYFLKGDGTATRVN